jgi:hypothetical protein
MAPQSASAKQSEILVQKNRTLPHVNINTVKKLMVAWARAALKRGCVVFNTTRLAKISITVVLRSQCEFLDKIELMCHGTSNLLYDDPQ